MSELWFGALLVFFYGALSEATVAARMMFTADRRPFKAAVFASASRIFQLLVVINIVHEPILLTAVALGDFAGAWTAVWLSRRRRNKQ